MGLCQRKCTVPVTSSGAGGLNSSIPQAADPISLLQFLAGGDPLRSYQAAMDEIGNAQKQEIGRWANNRLGKWTTGFVRS